MRPIQRTIKDDEGNEHAYVIVPYGGVKACDMHIELLELIGSALDGPRGLASGLRGVAEMIARKGSSKFVRRVLEGVMRDGEEIGGLEDQALAAFEQAFAANIGELYAALHATLEVNYGRFFSRRLKVWFETQLPTLILGLNTFADALPATSGLTGGSGPSGSPGASPSPSSSASGASST